MRAKPRRSAAEPNIFDFRPRQAPRVRRAWERAPASPRAPGRKGKKVWKRAGPRAAADEASNADDGGDAAFHGHGVKRQRTKHMPAVPARATRKNQQFVSTLQDQAPGTPKRKAARRRTLRNSTLPVPAVRRSLRVSTSPSKRRLSRRSVVTGDQLGPANSAAANSNPQAPSPAPDEWEDVPASQPGSPDLAPSAAARAPAEPQGVVVLQSGEPIEIIAETGDATAILPADVHTCETTAAKPEGFENSAPKPSLQETWEENPAPGEEPCMAHQGQVSPDWQHFTASDAQQTGQGSHVEEPLQDNMGYDTAQGSEVEAGLDSCFEHQEASEDDAEQEFIAADVADQLSEGLENGQIDLSTKLDDAEPTDAAADCQAETISPAKKKPIARISDDTSMLKAFVSRAQAKKAAAAQVLNAAKSSPSPPSKPSTPRRSPRKILGALERNSPSPRRARGATAAVPGTPPGKVACAPPDGEDEDDEEDEIALAPASQRRSTRQRTVASTHGAAHAAPHVIPLRRLDGSEFVRIQRSAAQELALATRANTRRNKGRAQMPPAVLQTLAAAEPGGAAGASATGGAKRGPGRPRKAVDWDATLVYYPDAAGDQSIGDDKARRLPVRRLGSSNGTPAVKKTKPPVPAQMARPSTPRRKGRGRG